MQEDISNIERLIDNSRYSEAIQDLQDFLKGEPENVRSQQLLALAYSRSGALEKAKDYFEPLYRNHTNDEESSGIMGSIYKRMFQTNQDVNYGKLAAEIYESNYEKTGSPYTGINAASMLVMTGNASRGKAIAQEIINSINKETSDAWSLATLAEAHLLLKQKEKTIEYYIAARAAIDNEWGKISSIYRQLWLLKHYLRVPKEILELYPAPTVGIFAGHMIDHPSRENPRFTEAMVPAISEAIRLAIDKMDIQIGYSSLACGADILFAEAMLEANKPLHVLLPFDKNDFLQESVSFAGKSWVERFNALINKIQPEYISTTGYNGRNDTFDLLTKVLLGKGYLHSKRLGTDPTLLTVLSARSLEAKTGGTRYLQNVWPDKYQRHNINVDDYFKDDIAQASIKPELNKPEYNKSVKASYYCLIQPGDKEDIPLFKNTIKEILEANANDYHSLSEMEGKLLVHAKTETLLAEIIQEIIDISADKQVSLPTVICDAGLIDFGNEPHFEGSDFLRIKNLVNTIYPSEITSTESFAACLALKTNAFEFNYVGKMRLNGAQDISVYSMRGK